MATLEKSKKKSEGKWIVHKLDDAYLTESRFYDRKYVRVF